MRAAAIVAAVFVVLAPVAQAVAQSSFECRVVGVTDGDTLTCLTREKRQVKVRLAQIDAPEKAQPFGERAKQALSGMVFGKEVTIIQRDIDRYGRTVGTVIASGKDVNLAMVESGMAWVYERYATDPAYFEAQDKARSRRIGLWADAHPVKPEEWRRSAGGNGGAHVTHQGGLFTCGSKRTCSQMVSCEEAKFFLTVCGLRSLDRNGDGAPCESLCK
jgi:endonuclease YncB( thermonuclease family)